MDFSWSKEQLLLKKEAKEFALKNRRADILDLDKTSTFPREQWDAYGAAGYFGLTIPVEYGGKGLDFMACISVMEGLGYGSNDSGILVSIIAHIWSCVDPIYQFGTEDQKKKYLPVLCSGKTIGVHAITEPEGGSDALSNMKTLAEEKDDHYLVNGVKHFITNGEIADLILVLLKMKTKEGPEKLSCLLVETKTPGFSTKKIEKMGLKTSPFNRLEFHDCKIPKENLLGNHGAGNTIFNYVMAKERAFILATQIGLMEQQLESCVKYARSRKQFNQKIIDFQGVGNLIADMRVRLEASRLLVYKVAWLNEQGKNTFQFSSIAKLYVSESLVQNSISAMKIHGGYGYTTELDVERQLRDSMGYLFTSGTSEIMRNIITKLE